MTTKTFAASDVLTASDMNTYCTHTGGAWNSWTPTVTQSVGVTATITYARYFKAGRMVTCSFLLTCTSSGTAANAVVIGGLPFNAVTASNLVCGTGNFTDTGTGNHPVLFALASATTLSMFITSAGPMADARLGITGFAAAVVNTDLICGTFTYEATS